ncbi:FAD-linked oxidase C-terminal domain-containing protein [Balneolales bacterium ANBcel1]|nr:FAD-linked oxidase C-terminal domain-containing protein [Balneolales bacterium ANBcel1]
MSRPASDPAFMDFSPFTRRLYASDASIYEERPLAVAFPRNAEDVRLLASYARTHNLPVTMRAGGTSLAGQTTGSGIIADISRHMNRVLEIDPQRRIARVQPGVIRDQLNREAAAHGLLFGPDTSTTNRCMLGGMIGNNSCGSYSIMYGTTREHVEELHVILSDGSPVHFRPLSEQELSDKVNLPTLEGRIYREMLSLLKTNRDLILRNYPHPDIPRRNTGYALDRLCEMHPVTPGGRPFNLSELLCGSEGTLALVTEAVVRLEPIQKHRLLLIPHFTSLREALESTVDAVAFDPAAVELADRHILDATKGNLEQNRNRFFLQGEPEALLMIEFQGNNYDDIRSRALELTSLLQQKKHGYAWPLMEDPSEMARVWNLRKAGLGLLMGHLSDSSSPEFVDDTAVRVADLPDYIADFEKIMERHHTQSVYYAHASVGELHLRPIIDIKTEEGLEKLKAIAVEVADLVKSYRGSLSGEHGDGRIRSHLIERMVGPEVMKLLRRVKELWDPEFLLNRGKIIDPEPMDRHLRYSPQWRDIHVDTVFHWRAEGGFGNALELCNGAGVCRKKAESGGTMCPSYMATLEEKDSTRGRANMFRQIFAERRQDGFTSDEIHDALALCLSCKACKTECPANVDMAKMKAEFQHGRHLSRGTSRADRFFGNPERLYPLAGAMAPLVNFAAGLPPVRGLFEYLYNIHPKRNLPAFHRTPFTAPLKKSTPTAGNGSDGQGPKVLLVVDWFTDYHDPQVAEAAFGILERLGCRVTVMGPLASGRTQISRGLLDQARAICETNIRKLSKYAEAGFALVGLEPSEILTFRDEYPDLCGTELQTNSRKVAEATYLLEEFLCDVIPASDIKMHFSGGGETVHVHGHCHAKALTGMAPVINVLTLADYRPFAMETGCCGMAGSFGYDKDNFEVSLQIGELALFPAVRQLGNRDLLCAHGFSCRHQIADGTGRESFHTAQIIWNGRRRG